jgi:argininosuccinate lyase
MGLHADRSRNEHFVYDMCIRPRDKLRKILQRAQLIRWKRLILLHRFALVSNLEWLREVIRRINKNPLTVALSPHLELTMI